MTDTFGYSYDLGGRLTEVKKNGLVISTYSYDSNGNRLSLTTPTGTVNATYDDQDRLLSYGGVTYTYTANGELASKAAGGGTTTYSYDVPGNLMASTLSDGTRIEYVIHGNNRRIGKKVNDLLVQGFLYQDQLKPLAELDGNNSVLSRFVYGTKVNAPEYMVRGGVTYRIISDHLGSPRLVTEVSTGTVVQKMDYGEFGDVILDTNPGFQPFGFAGGIYDQDTKLTRFGMRDYDAEVAKWTARDPIRFNGGSTNLYAYVNNNPQLFTDPNGLFSVWGALKFVGKIGAGVLQIGPLSIALDLLGGPQCIGGCPLNSGEERLLESWREIQNELERQRKFIEETDKFLEDLCRTGRYPLSCGTQLPPPDEPPPC